jgi:hypothetical protein
LAKATVATIGFTKTAEGFFERLLESGVKKLIDVRLHNTSQLAGFAKADDLAYFLKKIGGIAYAHQPLFAPTDAMLKAYRRDKGDWGTYEKQFLALMAERQVENKLKPSMLDGACLLCPSAAATAFASSAVTARPRASFIPTLYDEADLRRW